MGASTTDSQLLLEAARLDLERRQLQSESTWPLFVQLQSLAKNPTCLPNLLHSCVRLLFAIVKDSEAPWTAKLAASLSVGYVLSPIQLIPSFIPIIGQMDDVAILLLGMTLVRKCAGEAIVAKHRAILQDRAARHEKHRIPPILK
jgi:uncharacterized membrane protein YkvA (DUF1232 family)